MQDEATHHDDVLAVRGLIGPAKKNVYADSSGESRTNHPDSANQIDQNGDPDTGVSINDTQISVQYKYQNTMSEPMQYNLTIQRSTGRFFESFVTMTKHQSFLERTGRCVYLKSNFKE